MELETLFNDQSFLTLALTHKSWVNEHAGIRESNERIEFLGDAILEFVVSKDIFANFPDKEEGYLTVLRANLVNTVNLGKVAQRLNLGDKLYLSKGEEETGGRTNISLLANTVEAIIGALYLDGGLSKAEEFIHTQLLAQIDETLAQPLKDPKSRLQEIVQAQGLSAPRYDVLEENGPDHNKEFTIQVIVDGKPIAKGQGKNKSEAAQMAAEKGLLVFSPQTR
jgi:ribonuclease III